VAGVPPADLLGGVGRSNVRDNELEVGESLRKDGFEGRSQIVDRVEDGQPDRDFGHRQGPLADGKRARVNDKKQKENRFSQELYAEVESGLL
jgi:hypothetical protein